MAHPVPNGNPRARRARCWPARTVGIIGLILALWAWGYSVGALQESVKELPGVMLIGMMIVGGFIDCLRVGREGTGGLIVVIAGAVFYLFLLFDALLLKTFSSPEAQRASLLFTVLLFLAGVLFCLCGRKRRRLNK